MTQPGKALTVKALIEVLQTLPEDMLVGCVKYSEMCLMTEEEVSVQASVVKACKPRPDGWIHSARPDKDLQEYFIFPGN